MTDEKRTDAIRRAKHVVENRIDEHSVSGSAPRAYEHEPSEDQLRTDQQREAQASWAGPGVPLMTEGMAKGMVWGTFVGGAIGAVVGAVFSFIPVGDLAWGWRLLIFAACGALAGGTAGAVYWGGREPELSGETNDLDGRPQSGTTLRDPRTDDRGR